MSIKQLLATFLLALSLPLTAAESKPVEPALRSSVDKALATTDDTIVFSVILTLPEAYKTLEIPHFADKIDGLRIVDPGSEETQNLGSGMLEKKRQLKLKADISGSYILPAISVAYTNAKNEQKTLESSEIFLEINAKETAAGGTEKGADDKEQLRDIKALSHSPRDYTIWWIILGILVSATLGGVLCYYLYQRYKKKAAIPLPPHEEALLALEKLSSDRVLDQERLKEFYYRLSGILRQYVERQYDFKARDRTLEEIKGQIPTLATLEAGYQQEFLSILSYADLVKFANEVPAREKSESYFEQSKNFILATKPVEKVEGDIV